MSGTQSSSVALNSPSVCGLSQQVFLPSVARSQRKADWKLRQTWGQMSSSASLYPQLPQCHSNKEKPIGKCVRLEVSSSASLSPQLPQCHSNKEKPIGKCVRLEVSSSASLSPQLPQCHSNKEKPIGKCVRLEVSSSASLSPQLPQCHSNKKSRLESASDLKCHHPQV
ncbi:hypothetical protein K457DRAFT_1824769 [Linnemannia elongata AG-77]|uniref:Uncharacterized protein n=1 Tax=Linnemannia elongata AG-77 TaxID=1314771 RepID=A0A197JFX8_9FUNG|nr:hypothetical protein K457DRAFT_1824769 [Linnemannia elongata AG-77]